VSERAAEDGPVLGIFGHPDDAEIACGGTLAKLAAAGRDVHLLILTNGDRGSQDPALDRAELAAIRARESEEAGRIMGLRGVTVLDVHDGELENSPAIRARVVRVIREVRPTTVLSCDPTAWFFENSESRLNAGSAGFYNHSDHRTAGVIALDSVYPGSGNPHYFVEHLAEGLEAWDVHDVWLGWTNEPNHYEDVTGFIERKVEALLAHASQVTGDGIRFFRDWLPREAAEAGAKIGVEHAEGFRVLDLR
jgi:LmbE family N-acetylglucosaminyl deacetylase